MQKNSIRHLALGVTLGLFLGGTVSAEDLSFKVSNTTDSAIKKILVSEDGQSWGFFNIGAGIGAQEQATLVWAAHTDDQSCEQYFKAVFADGSESEAVSFDFCEEGLELSF